MFSKNKKTHTTCVFFGIISDVIFIQVFMSKKKQKAVLIIKEIFGESTATLYSQFYAELPEEKVVISLRELLIEATGEKKAREYMATIKIKA